MCNFCDEVHYMKKGLSKECDKCGKPVKTSQRLCKQCYYKEQGMKIENALCSENIHIQELEEQHKRGLK